MAKKNKEPVCPRCSGKLLMNKGLPGRVICRKCNMSFDRKRILELWDGEKYIQLGRDSISEDEVLRGAANILDELWDKYVPKHSLGSHAADDPAPYFH